MGGRLGKTTTDSCLRPKHERGKKKKTHRRTPTQTQKPCREVPSRHTSTELIIPHSVMVYFGPTMANMYNRTEPTSYSSSLLSGLSLSFSYPPLAFCCTNCHECFYLFFLHSFAFGLLFSTFKIPMGLKLKTQKHC